VLDHMMRAAEEDNQSPGRSAGIVYQLRSFEVFGGNTATINEYATAHQKDPDKPTIIDYVTEIIDYEYYGAVEIPEVYKSLKITHAPYEDK
jgi:hypothetical protein